MTVIDSAQILPPAFLERLHDLLSPTALQRVLVAFGCERMTTFRINTLRAEIGPTITHLRDSGFDLQPLPWLPNAYWIPPSQRRQLTESAFMAEGKVYIQNPASMLPPLLLSPQPEDKVLDLAAAPGSKTLQLAAMMGNHGWISAVEVVKERFFRLRANLERYGATNVHTYHKDGGTVWRHVAEQFDKVLLDAPCSSEGQFSALVPESFAYWSERKIKEMARKQKQLIYSAVQCLKPGGRLVYSTCTLAPEENEAIIDHVLGKFPQLEVEPIALEIPESESGRDGWGNKIFDPRVTLARRILPDRISEGFFVCVLRKQATTLNR